MKTTAIPVEKINRTELRRRVPHGGITKIVEKTGYSRWWVTEVLNGNKTNLDILQAAYDLYWSNDQSLKVRAEDAEDIIADDEMQEAA